MTKRPASSYPSPPLTPSLKRRKLSSASLVSSRDRSTPSFDSETASYHTEDYDTDDDDYYFDSTSSLAILNMPPHHIPIDAYATQSKREVLDCGGISHPVSPSATTNKDVNDAIDHACRVFQEAFSQFCNSIQEEEFDLKQYDEEIDRDSRFMRRRIKYLFDVFHDNDDEAAKSGLNACDGSDEKSVFPGSWTGVGDNMFSLWLRESSSEYLFVTAHDRTGPCRLMV